MEESGEFRIEGVDHWSQMLIRFERILWRPQAIALRDNGGSRLRPLRYDHSPEEL